jgi:REP element-mobilizing transposase RayT
MRVLSIMSWLAATWREPIFYDEADRPFFVQTLREACERTGWRVHAWVLMKNHYHLMLETPEANLVEGMKWFAEHLYATPQYEAPALGTALR